MRRFFKVEALAKLQKILGSGKIKTQPEELFVYGYDATAGLKNQMPLAVVFPESTEEVVEIVKWANEYKIPLYPRGSGTNLSGGTVPTAKGVVVELNRLNKILEIDLDNLTATVEPGVIINDLNEAVKPYGLIYPPDPGTVTTATMGGSVAECSGGLRGLKYGVTKHYIMGVEAVIGTGELLKFGGKTVKNVTGYDLPALMVGSEGTLGIITKIIVKLIPAPVAKKSFLAVFNSIDDAGNAIAEIIKNRVIPATLEIMDQTTIRTVEKFKNIGLPVDAQAILLVETDGYPEQVEMEAKIIRQVLEKNRGEVSEAKNDEEREKLWEARRAALPALAQVSPTTVLEDATVPRSQVPAMLKRLKEISEKYNLTIGTFGHAGDGNLHPTILTDETNREEWQRVEKAVEEIFKAALELGGTLSGEHGIGMAKNRFLLWEMGEAGVNLLKRLKLAFDPNNILNPGKMA
ncbi:putative glycolate oxidase, GlcD subunit [Carboxydothermus hydrogenoformans Z-2901]|uniref:Putative glycolate oxidase, GlcD subunit n=1 Tax=Carboxydothermus hydrogenoformans (strain ATCC BAA-161 / DSM 6008 / Z-2901) TaxID=246194 RepID=Q3AEZ1_CARHZ|nr:putative glycolate oxidase, GlcD subunit [Carboxydothermus hydrogenoformans Z-2901]